MKLELDITNATPNEIRLAILMFASVLQAAENTAREDAERRARELERKDIESGRIQAEADAVVETAHKKIGKR